MKIQHDKAKNLILFNSTDSNIKGAIFFLLVGIIIFFSQIYILNSYSQQDVSFEVAVILNFAEVFYVFLYILILFIVSFSIYKAIFWTSFQFKEEKNILIKGKTILGGNFKPTESYDLNLFNEIIIKEEIGPSGKSNYNNKRTVLLLNITTEETIKIYTGEYRSTQKFVEILRIDYDIKFSTNLF